MKNYIASQKTPFSKSVISILMVLIWWMVPILGIAQDSPCCDCEKMIWNVKVTLMDGWAPVQSIDYKTFNGEIKLTKKEKTKEEFPESVNLKPYTFEEGGLVIRLDDQKIVRESGLGGTHSLSEIDMTLHISASLAENKMWYKEESKCSATAKNVGLQNENIDFKLINLKPETSHSDGDESRVYNKLEKTYKYKHAGSYDIINKEAGSATWWLKPMISIESEDADCHSVRCYMPLRLTFIWGKSNTDESETSIDTPLPPEEDLINTPNETGIAQDADCCDCEKMIWDVKVTLMDGMAPVKQIDFKTYNGEIKLTEKEPTDEEFPESVNLKPYIFDEGSLVIRLDDQKITRESGSGHPHSISEINMALHISATLAENKMWYKVRSKCNATSKNVGIQHENIDFNLINLKPRTAHSNGEESYLKTNKYKHTGLYEIINKETGSATWWLKPMITIESEDADCHSARCHMPLRVIFLWGESNTDESETNIVTPLRPQEDLIFTAYGTGVTSGKVIELEVSNPTPDPIMFSIGPAVVPPTGEYQGYTILDEITASVDPGETNTYPVDGWCYDIHSKPVQEGEVVTYIGDWLSETEISTPFPPGTSLPENSSFEISTIYEEAEKNGGVPTSGMLPTYIGTPIPFEYSIDIREDVDEAAPFLLTSMQIIDAVYDSLYAAGEIETPFSSDPVKEALNGKQQPYWIYTSLLQGEPYIIDDFEAKIIDQFETNSGIDYDDAPEEVKDELSEGTQDFWSTFTFVGEEAKVLYDVKKTKKCKCESMKLEIYFLRERNGTVTGLSKKVTIEGYLLNQGSVKLVKLPMKLKKGDLFSFLVTDNQLNCICSSKKFDCDPEGNWQYKLGRKLKGGKADDYKSSEFDVEERGLDEEDLEKMNKMEDWLRENIKSEEGKVPDKKLKKLIKEQIYIEVIKDLPKKRTFPWRYEISNTCFGEDCGGVKGRKKCIGVLKIEITHK